MFSFFSKRLNDISISRKLYFTVGIMALLVTVELCTLWFAVSTLSSVRSFVAGEGLWSKAEKDAVLYLRMYAYSHKERDYQTFKQFLAVSKGDKLTRQELQKQHPDLAIARKGFIAGKNHPDDVDGMIKLLQRFHQTYYLNKAFTLWADADPMIEELERIGDSLHVQMQIGPKQAYIEEALGEMTYINQRLTFMEDGFSSTLGEGSRWLEGLVRKILLALSLTIGTTSILITISVSSGIEKGINAINNAANDFSHGQLKTRARVFSKDEIGTLAVAFNQMADKLETSINDIKEKEQILNKEKERAEALEKVKRLFLMNMSHELRTPMNAILGFAHLLEDATVSKEQKEYIKFQILAAEELLNILNDILDFSKIESGNVILETMPFNLHQMVDDLATEMIPKAVGKDLHFQTYVDHKVPEVLLGDAKRLEQVLHNLLSNAFKFTSRGRVGISIHVVNDQQHHQELEFSISDTGVGIADEVKERIFESFEQAESGPERRFGGTGLGLSIVKQLVELQGGKVQVNSTQGRGSEFYFRLSFLKVKTGWPSEQPLAIQPQREVLHPKEGRIRVLVVDDNPMNRLVVNKLLQKKGFEAEEAENGKIALSKFSSSHFDMVLMDLQMPEMDGYEATRQIRALPGDESNVPIIAITAHTIQGERERCLAIGMNEFISKPFNPLELYEKMDELLK